MSSSINTNGLDVNYPIPGQNNNSQGFRNNFTNIKTNLDTAANEISDLQNKVVLKTALANSVLNNDMANTLISNASTLGFRATTYNLGNALAGTIVVDCSLGDVQYGTLQGNIALQFGSWAPTGTQSQLKLQLGRANANVNYNIAFPTEAVVDKNHGFVLLENFSTPNGVPTVSFPYDVTQLNLTITSNDCGNSLFVEPTNRPFETTQIQTGTPPSTGRLGDVVGTVYVDTGTSPLVVTNVVTSTITLSGVTITGTAGQFSCTATSLPLAVGQPLTISGTFGGTGSIVTPAYTDPTTYYIIDTNGSTTFTLSDTLGGAAIVTTAGTPTGLTYTVDANYLRMANTANLYSGLGVQFTGTTLEPNITLGNTYYVKNVLTSNTFTISSTVDGSIVDVGANASGAMTLNPVQYMYVAVQDYNATANNITITQTTAPNLITVTSGNIAAQAFANNQPVIFTGNVANINAIGLQSNTVYYIKNAWNSNNNMTVSQTRYNGLAGPEYQGIVTVAANVEVDVTSFTNGSDIFRRVPLNPF